MKLYFKYVKFQLHKGLVYKGSLWMTLIGQLMGNVATILGIYFLFQKFGNLGDYVFSDTILTYAIVLFVFAFDEMMLRGFDEFDDLIRTGDMDTLLLRPRNIVLQVCGQKVELMKIGRVVLGLVLIIIACVTSNISWNPIKALVLIEMLISGIVTFFGVYLLTSSITIFTIQKAEFINIFTDGGKELCYYPLDIFKKFLTKFFTFIIPFASFNYLPLRYLLGFSDASVWNVIYPLISIIFLVISYFVFNICMKHYKSCG